jgi:putative hydrolase of the HAD superfamily
MAEIRALCFDLWGTLVSDPPGQSERRRQVRVRLLGEALASAGHSFGSEGIAGALQAFARYHVGLQAQEKDVSSAERAVAFLERLEPSLAGRLSAEALRSVEEAVAGAARHVLPSVAEGAHEVLAGSRRRGLGVGLVSNTGYTAGRVLREFFDGWGLQRYFDVLIFSDEAGEAKPAAGIFQRALAALGVRAEEAGFLGDTPQLDVVGPMRIGMWSVQIGERRLDGAEPHARISRLSELFPALESLRLLRRRSGAEGPAAAGGDR